MSSCTVQSVQQITTLVPVGSNNPINHQKVLEAELWRLCEAYKASIDSPLDSSGPKIHPSTLVSIINNPLTAQIKFDETTAAIIGHLLLLVARQSPQKSNGEFIIRALLDTKIAHLVHPNGNFGLGRVLVYAAFHLNFFFVQALLAHSRIGEITSAEIPQSQPFYVQNVDLNSKAADCVVERDYHFNGYGFTEALYSILAINRDGSKENSKIPRNDLYNRDQQYALFKELVVFINHHCIPIDIHQGFGLADTLVLAAKIRPDLITTIFSITGCQNIVANALSDEGGGLDNALFFAAQEGYKEATNLILGHPNARDIAQEQLTEAALAARANNHHDVAALIQNFQLRIA